MGRALRQQPLPSTDIKGWSNGGKRGKRKVSPVKPRVIHAPGHTPGECCLLLESRRVLFSGDALITLSILSGAKGPQLSPKSFNSDPEQALESLARLEGVDADLMLPGHGEPWSGGVAAAVAEARRRGVR